MKTKISRAVMAARARGPIAAAVVGRRIGALRARVVRGWSAAEPLRRRVRPILAVVSPLGWTVLGGGVVAWWLAGQLGWIELAYAAAACLLLFVLCALMTIGRARLDVAVDIDPRRVVVGSRTAGRVVVTNSSTRRLLPIGLELPVGEGIARFNLPSIGGGESHEELFLVPTARRAVIRLGPATSVRGDSLGLLRRRVAWTSVIEFFVHPRTVPLEPLGSGLLRDLEGQTTNDVSMSDLAFHTLRDYAPGDDRRYIHWRSSAKVGAGSGGGKFLVRQFLDTRRSHLGLVVDGRLDSYAEPDDLEVAISVAASMAVRALVDEMETTALICDQVTSGATPSQTMDSFARALPNEATLSALGVIAARTAPDTSVLVVVTGPKPTFAELRLAASHFAPETRKVAIRVDPDARLSMTAVDTLTLLTLPQLSDLPLLLQGASIS